MPPRAVIIAIEKYPHAVGLANELPGTNNAGDEFWQWFVENKLKPVSPPVDPKELVIGCVDHPFEWRTSGTTRPEILEQIKTLVNKGRDDTSELYFFFAGHGFSYTDMGWTRALNVLVTSEYTTKEDSGAACIKLEEIQEKLWAAMGPGDHYYFVDACRNTATHKEINVLDTGKTFAPSELGKPYRYTLYSTIKGTAAEVDSGFSAALVSGLKGSGHAKGWDEAIQDMFVKFDLLVEYVKNKLPTQTVDPNKDGNGKGLILQLDPVPQSECKIKIENASQTDRFKVVAKTNAGQLDPVEFVGDSYLLKLRPLFYNLEVTRNGTPIPRIAPPPPKMLDLYDTCEVKFEIEIEPPVGTGGGAAPETSILEFAESQLPDVSFDAVDVHSGTTIRDLGLAPPSTLRGGPRRRRRTGKGKEPGVQAEVPPGTYMLRMRERGVVVGRRQVTVEPGEKVKIDLLERPESKVRSDILKAIAHDPNAKVAVLPELGPTANMDVSLWLSLFGAERIVGPVTNKKKTGLDLASFEDIEPGGSCVYILAAFEKSQGKFGVGTSAGNEVTWKVLKQVPQLSSVYQWRQQSEPGPYLLSVQLPEQVPLTFATYCLPNRVTFFVITEDELGRVAVRQYMLPVRKLIPRLPVRVRQRIESNPLSLVRYISLVQSQFERKRSLQPEPNSDEVLIWQDLVRGKWIDPVASLMAAYFFLRLGYAGPEAKTKDRELIKEVTGNLREFFGDLPDVAVIRRRMGDNAELPTAPPLILDGILLEESDASKTLTLPQQLLDFSGPWTSWRGAVNNFNPEK